ncbi:MAG TPA: hypothetical protein VER39_08825 [Nocardioidaceae bacterium]|nr:hypothetical protein [Nocardioidaceae bacterium]
MNVDVVRSTVRHSARRVTASSRYGDLVRNQDTATVSFRILTSGNRTYLLQLSAGPGNRKGRVVFERYAGSTLVPVRCAGVRRSVQYVRNRLVVSVPRRCLKRPKWVSYTGEATAIEEGPGAAYTDALLSGDPVNDLFSPRIRRR